MPLYKPLSIGAGGEDDITIRLINLPAGESTGDISCTLMTCPLSEAVPYEAVSYCWGHPDDTTEIQCDGYPITIPSNLYSFLLRTRAKGAQVAAMQHIYRKASKTLIWLGKEDSDGTVGLEFAQTLSVKAVESLSASGEMINEKSTMLWHRLRSYYSIPSVWAPGWGAFFRNLDREWFRRVWVVQELALSTEPWIIIGNREIRWVELAAAYYYITVLQPWVLEFYGSNNVSHVQSMQVSAGEIAGGLKTKCFELLSRHKLALSTNDRDHIFAFYGLSAHEDFKNKGIKLDYEMSVEVLYKKVAIASIQGANDLDFLDIPRLERQNCLEIPSWVPDWRNSSDICFSLLMLDLYQHLAKDDLPTYRATGNSICYPFVDDQTASLLLSGYTIDRVEILSKTWELPDVSGYQGIHKQALLLQKNQAFMREWETTMGFSSKSTYRTGESLEDVLWQTCLAGNFRNNKGNMRAIYNRYAKRQWYLRKLHTLRLDGFVWVWVVTVLLGHVLRFFGFPNPEVEYRVLVAHLINRRTMKGVEGYVGMVPKLTQVGDYIVLCEGGKLPLVLRPAGGKNSEWEFIGDCYVHGVMDGELWDERKTREKVVLV